MSKTLELVNGFNEEEGKDTLYVLNNYFPNNKRELGYFIDRAGILMFEMGRNCFSLAEDEVIELGKLFETVRND